MKKLNYAFIVAGIIGVASAVVLTPGLAERYFSSDRHLTAQGLRSLRFYRMLALGGGLTMLAVGVTATLSGSTPEQVVIGLGPRLHPALLGGLAAVIRFYEIDAKSLWYDELISVVVARGSLPTVIQQVSQRPPLYDVVLHLFLRLGNSDFIVRLPAALFGIAAVVSLYYLIRELFDTEIAVFSGLLLTVSRFHIEYSQESRAYGLFCLLAILSIFFFVRYIRRQRRGDLAWWFLASLAIVYTHYYGAFVLLAQVVCALVLVVDGARRKDAELDTAALAPYGLGLLMIGILYLPWVPSLLRHTDAPMVWREAPGNGSYSYLGGALPSYRTTVWAFSWPSSLPWSYFARLRLVTPLLGLSGLAFHLIRRQWLRPLSLFALWAGVGLLFATVAGLNLGARYFIFVLPAYLTFVALGLVAGRQLIQRAFSTVSDEQYYLVVIFVLQLIVVPSLNDYYYLVQKEDWRGVGGYLDEHAGPGDAVLVLGGSAGQLKHYYQGDADVFDASDRYGDPARIGDTDELRALVTSKGCVWVFVSGHANLLYEYWEPDKARAVHEILEGRMVAVEGVYGEDTDRRVGLYRSPYCTATTDD